MTNEEKYKYILDDWNTAIKPLGEMPLNLKSLQGYVTDLVQIAGAFCKKYKGNSLEHFAYKTADLYVDYVSGVYNAILRAEE